MRVEGTQKLLKKLRALGQEAEKRIDSVTMATASQIATDATRKLNGYNGVDPDGKIAQSINSMPDGKLRYSISVNELPMGAYVEFGTGIFVEVADEWKDKAWAFYVNGKGWMNPSPYLYPAYVKGREQYEKDLQDLLDHLTQRFNN